MDIQTRPDPVARARELGAEIAAAADEIERTRRIPEALLERLHDSRLFRMLLPRSAGGDETEPAVYVAAIEELARHDASIAWNVFVANSSALIAAYLEPAVNHAIFADPRSIVAWGPPNASRASAVDGGYRLTGKWDFASGCRQARWMGAHCHVLEADGTLAAQPLRPAHGPHAAVSGRARRPCSTPGGRSGCAARRRTPIASTICSCPRRSAPRARTRRCAASAARSMPSPCRASTRPGSPPWRSASRARCCPSSSRWRRRKAPRGLARLADNAVVQADVARAEARLGSARAYLIETLTTIYAHADDVAPIEVADRARVRLACTNAIQARGRGGGLRLQGSRRRRDLPGQPVRAPLPRHAHALAADPGPRRPFRSGRADPARRAARGVSLTAP